MQGTCLRVLLPLAPHLTQRQGDGPETWSFRGTEFQPCPWLCRGGHVTLQVPRGQNRGLLTLVQSSSVCWGARRCVHEVLWKPCLGLCSRFPTPLGSCGVPLSLTRNLGSASLAALLNPTRPERWARCCPCITTPDPCDTAGRNDVPESRLFSLHRKFLHKLPVWSVTIVQPTPSLGTRNTRTRVLGPQPRSGSPLPDPQQPVTLPQFPAPGSLPGLLCMEHCLPGSALPPGLGSVRV